MTIISPSILSADFNQLGADCRMVLDAGAQMLHYDVMDGHFVPNISFGVPVLKSLHKALPDAFYDVHLMITHPQQYAEAFAKAGASLLNFHLECDDDIQETIDAIKAQSCKVGMTIKPGTPVEELGYYLDQLGLTEGTAFTAGLVFRLRCVRDEMLTGAMLFSAVFLLNEPYTCAHHRLGRILYGVMVGAFTMGFRYFGVYETGVCFAILAVNSISGWLDRTEVRLHELIKSGRQFKEKKTGKGDAE